MCEEYEKDRQAIGDHEVCLRYGNVLLSKHYSNEYLTADEALNLLNWLEQHKSDLSQRAEMRRRRQV